MGRDGGLPWRIPSDLKTFRRITMGKPMVMGRKTFDAIGRALDGRDTVVVTGDPRFSPDGVIVAPTLEAALSKAEACAKKRKAKEIMVVGGAHVFAQALPFAERIYWTTVHARPPGDVTFPPLDWKEWRSVSEEPTRKDDGDEFPWSLDVLKRKTRPKKRPRVRLSP